MIPQEFNNEEIDSIHKCDECNSVLIKTVAEDKKSIDVLCIKNKHRSILRVYDFGKLGRGIYKSLT